MANNTIYIVQELHTFPLKVSLQIIAFPSILPLYFSTNLSTIFFLLLQSS